MGKQKGDGGRSKNRPSSSSLAASLLPQGTSSVGFGGYLGSARVGLPSTSLAEDSVHLSDVDTEVIQHMKRLNRKDPATKLKALASLGVLFKSRPAEEIVLIIPQWAYEYKRLVLDHNRDVRRATHEAMTCIVTAVRRGLAPHLKSLMGPWWASQFDPFPDVSQAARHSIEAIFPSQEKKLDALSLCVDEIFVHLDENLRLTPQALSIKAISVDELEDMHQRAIMSSLLALATLLDVFLGNKCQVYDSEKKLTSKAKTAVVSFAENIFSEHKFFLNFLKSEDPRVRSATYSALANYIRHIPQVYNERNNKVLSVAILGAFQEKDASCHSSMWDMILTFTKEIPEGWFFCNIEKDVLSRFWNFLRSGCFGSQKISYPALVLFVNSIPSKSVGDQFVLSFFRNLWAGRVVINSADENIAFFEAFKECFLCIVSNYLRFSTRDGAISHLPAIIVNDILVMMLWHDYIMLESPNKLVKTDHELSSGSDENHTLVSNTRQAKTLQNTNSTSYIQELGKFLVGILSAIFLKDKNLLNVFCVSFQNDCLELLQQGNCSDKIQRVADFYQLLNELSLKKEEEWPWEYLTEPMISRFVFAIISSDSPDGVQLLSVLIEVFGPMKIVAYKAPSIGGEQEPKSFSGGIQKGSKGYFIEVFKNEFVPWCLNGNKSSTILKISLLFLLMKDDCFSEQWNSIVSYLCYPGSDFGLNDLNIETSDVLHKVGILTVLMEGVREFLVRSDLSVRLPHASSYNWRHALIDNAAIYISHRLSYAKQSHVQFLRAVLGGATEKGEICFLSKEAIVLILEDLLENLIAFLRTSALDWAKLCYSSLSSSNTPHEMAQAYTSPLTCMIQMARFSLEVLEQAVNIFSVLDDDCGIVSRILASIYIVDWEAVMSLTLLLGDDLMSDIADITLTGIENVGDDLQEQVSRFLFGKELHVFRRGLPSLFWSNLGSSHLSSMRRILAKTVKLAVFEVNNFETDRCIGLCCEWFSDVLEIICYNNEDLQYMLDELLSEHESWPLWAAPVCIDGVRSAIFQDVKLDIYSNVPGHRNFVSFIDKLITSLGVDRVVGGFHAQSMIMPKMLPMELNSFSHCRVWLAVELLCTWEWQGGSASVSLLPILSKYAKSLVIYPEKNIFFAILELLLDCILRYGSNVRWTSYNVWTNSFCDSIIIQDPFMRAFLALLWTLLVKDNVWGESEASTLLQFVLNSLNATVVLNRDCLSVLPFVLSLITSGLSHKKSSSQGISEGVPPKPSNNYDLVDKNVVNWLETVLAFPSFSFGLVDHGEALEWVQVVLSCYPFIGNEIAGTFEVKVLRDISHQERDLLLRLFRKQQYCVGSSLADNPISRAPSDHCEEPPLLANVVLAKLITVSVGYCWRDFSQDDWKFVFTRSQKWILSLVTLSEEAAEKIDDISVEFVTGKNLERAHQEIAEAIQALDQVPVCMLTDILFMFCIVLQLVEVEAFDDEFSHYISLFIDQARIDLLRVFFSAASAEAIAKSISEEASSIVASSRIPFPQFWELVSYFVIQSPDHAKSKAVRSMALWDLSKGPISGLHALLFSRNPMSSLQISSFILLSTKPICHSFSEEICTENGPSNTESRDQSSNESTPEESLCLRKEIAGIIQKSSDDLLQLDLLGKERVDVFLAWALVLSHLQSLPPSSSQRVALSHYLQDSSSPTILDCIFQSIPLKLGLSSQMKKEVELESESSMAGNSARRAISTCSLLFSVESLWPVGTESMASLAGSIYGFMVRLLPAYVSNWFTSLHDRSSTTAIESFTKTWCSPLLLDELSQVKEAVFADENFSISVNKSALEIIATYHKDETGLDLVIRLSKSHPLRPIEVNCTRSLGISEVKKRKWLLSLIAFLRNQNGSIEEALRIWKNNIDKEFQGVEECPICYSILHTSNHSLPRLACRTCKHKFHSACLYKWFSTSHKSTCPLCQTPF